VRVSSEVEAGPRERPIWFAILSVSGAFALTLFVLWWAGRDPESVVIGLPGRHDAPQSETDRLADCLDCHVPFVGTPGSRCLGPGCHGDLATGTPPKEGPAMPIRFHASLRRYACTNCHLEHTTARTERIFTHDLIPTDARAACSRCHSGAGVAAHAATDALSCDLCHQLNRFTGTEMVHSRVANQACDLCHVAPKTAAHASVAGACSDCHGIDSWRPK
jgi:hypothetical protein